MGILSIHMGHNATATLAEDGRILAVLSQEKMDNIKNSAAFPGQAIEAMLAEVGWTMEDISEIVVASNVVYPPDAYTYLLDTKQRIVPASRWIRLAKTMESALGSCGKTLLLPVKATRQLILAQKGETYLNSALAELGLGDKPISHIEHHTCHARAAYHSFKEPGDNRPALIFTADGSGDGLSATVTLAANDSWQRLAATPASASLGGIYSNVTRFLGMKILEHEYKVMGLAPYAKQYFLETYKRIFDPVIWLDADNPLTFRSKLNTAQFYDYLVEHAVGERFDNLAAAAQYLIEDRVVEWVRQAIEKTNVRRIFTGGGLFMNVKLNKRLQEMEEVEEIHFMPSCGDESNPIGAAYAYYAEREIETHPLPHLYLGVSFDEAEIEAFIRDERLEDKYKVSRVPNIESTIADLLAQGEVVARFAGRCEWGARSLGNRAILAHPSHMESFYTVNDLIKSRDFWMPFAPSVLDSAAGKYLKGYDPNRVQAPYMITAFEATELAKRHLRAAMHQGDHTLRPQVVTESANPAYYRLLKEFEKRTGVGGVLNTSFNLHGYPLVATLEQALFTLENSGLKHLALGPFLITDVQKQQ
ncbi:MAG: hypothetical protein D6690_10755 [Nitrospirae bacterium]|nr:MAG: hypothetical protein D6690_10755 [Nitrospirota bacterium]